MQAAGPEAVDLTKESEATKKLYGMDDEATAKFGANCLMARRLVERGVRFIELYSRQRQRLGRAQRHRRQSRRRCAGRPTSRRADCLRT